MYIQEVTQKSKNCLQSAKPKSRKSKNALFSEWLNSWLKSQGALKPTTKQVYKSHIDNYINPNLGKIPLKKLSVDILQGFINDLDLSASTVKSIFSILKLALSYAEDNSLISNIWSKVKLPKKEKSIVQVLTENEQKRLESLLISSFDSAVFFGKAFLLVWSSHNIYCAVADARKHIHTLKLPQSVCYR